MSQRRAAKIYNVPLTTLGERRAGSTFRHDCTPNSLKLLKTEEEVIFQHILDLDTRGFPPWLAAVKDMADLLLAERHQALTTMTRRIMHDPRQNGYRVRVSSSRRGTSQA